MPRCKANQKVVAYRLNGDLFRVYDSARQAALSRHAYPRSIDKCIRGDTLTAFNYMWRRYPEDDIPQRIEPLKKEKISTKSKPIVEIDDNGNIINRYPSIKAASLSLHIDPHSIRDNLNNKAKQAKGHRFKYEKD